MCRTIGLCGLVTCLMCKHIIRLFPRHVSASQAEILIMQEKEFIFQHLACHHLADLSSTPLWYYWLLGTVDQYPDYCDSL